MLPVASQLIESFHNGWRLHETRKGYRPFVLVWACACLRQACTNGGIWKNRLALPLDFMFTQVQVRQGMPVVRRVAEIQHQTHKIGCCGRKRIFRSPLVGVAMLHIVSNDIAAYRLKKSGLPGIVLSWRDSLNEGPVLSGVPLETLSGIRARHLADNGWCDYASAIEEFANRDNCLKKYYEHDEVILWFGNDLSDQFQLLQLLEWFSNQDLDETYLRLISPSITAGRAVLRSIGSLQGVQLLSLFHNRAVVNDAQFALARHGWKSFCSSNPRAIEELLTQDTSALPYLRPTMQRHLEQFPAVGVGLCRTTRQILQAVKSGVKEPDAIMAIAEMNETPRFLAEPLFWAYVQSLTRGPRPLLCTAAGEMFHAPERNPSYTDPEYQELKLTRDGQAVIEHRADAIALNGIDRWRGGVYLNHRYPYWCWDPSEKQMTRVETTVAQY